MRAVMVVVVGISSFAAAEGFHRDVAIRGGMSWFTTETGQGEQAHGFAPYLDGELGLRFEYVTLAVTGGLFSLRSHFDWSDQIVRIKSDARYVGFDLGARLTFHGANRDGLFAGVGLATETFYETGHAATCGCVDRCYPCIGDGYMPFDRWSNTMLLELHAGYDVPTSHGVVDLIALGGFGGGPDEPRGDGWQWTLRLAAGTRF